MDDLELCLYDPEIAFVANLKIDAIYALYPESFCDKNLAIRKVFAFCDSGVRVVIVVKTGMYGLVMVMCHGLSQGDHVSQDSDDGDGMQLLPPAPL